MHLHWALPDALTRAANVYRIDGRVLNELRLLGLPCGSLVALLEHLAAANPSIASAVSAIVGQPGEFDPAAWGQIADPGLTAGPEFGSADAFIGDPAAPAPGTMVAVMGAAGRGGALPPAAGAGRRSRAISRGARSVARRAHGHPGGGPGRSPAPGAPG